MDLNFETSLILSFLNFSALPNVKDNSISNAACKDGKSILIDSFTNGRVGTSGNGGHIARLAGL
jgi:hypothetical protein